MGFVEMVMPSMGEGVMEATILTWLKKEGDTIEQDESVLEVATDKVDTEVPAVHDGVIEEILVKEGDVVEVGKPLARIRVSQGAEPENNTLEQPTEEKEVAHVEANSMNGATAIEPSPIAAIASSSDTTRFYSPLVRSIAETENISLQELEKIQGTGKEGRVTKQDILNYLEEKQLKEEASSLTAVVPPSAVPQTKPSQPTSVSVTPATNGGAMNGQQEIIQMDRMRKMIAERMVASKQTSPHVSSFVEADLTAIVRWRDSIKTTFKKQHGGSFTFTPIFVEAIAKAIADFPMINISVDGDKIIRHKDINVGVAVALPSGNLIVPIIRNANHFSLTGLALKVNDLATRARENKLRPDEVQGGTYTISNIGTFGNILGTPIIMQPQVAIMAFGAIVKKPAVVETPDGDMIAIRHKMYLSHSYDHRVVDGSLGGMFVKRVAEYLEGFDTSQTVG